MCEVNNDITISAKACTLCQKVRTSDIKVICEEMKEKIINHLQSQLVKNGPEGQYIMGILDVFSREVKHLFNKIDDKWGIMNPYTTVKSFKFEMKFSDLELKNGNVTKHEYNFDLQSNSLNQVPISDKWYFLKYMLEQCLLGYDFHAIAADKLQNIKHAQSCNVLINKFYVLEQLILLSRACKKVEQNWKVLYFSDPNCAKHFYKTVKCLLEIEKGILMPKGTFRLWNLRPDLRGG